MKNKSSRAKQAKPIPRYLCGVSAQRKKQFAYSLSDDMRLLGSFVHLEHDPDYELYTWPEQMDQRHIGDGNFGRYFTDDMEIDDGL